MTEFSFSIFLREISFSLWFADACLSVVKSHIHLWVGLQVCGLVLLPPSLEAPLSVRCCLPTQIHLVPLPSQILTWTHCKSFTFLIRVEIYLKDIHKAYMSYFSYREGYLEKCVMNNYFGIGLDAKISLEFNNKREEHPEKCRQINILAQSSFMYCIYQNTTDMDSTVDQHFSDYPEVVLKT